MESADRSQIGEAKGLLSQILKIYVVSLNRIYRTWTNWGGQSTWSAPSVAEPEISGVGCSLSPPEADEPLALGGPGGLDELEAVEGVAGAYVDAPGGFKSL
jgi:hypothetical protein